MPSGDAASAQLESRTYVMADEARPHFCVDAAHGRSYREGLVGVIAHHFAVLPDAERCSRRSQSYAFGPFNNQLIDRNTSRAIAAFDFKSRASVSAARHIHAHRHRRAGLRSARIERTPMHHERL